MFEIKQTSIRQRRGPTLKFTGRLIATAVFASRDGSEMRLELYKTQAGALIPVTIGVLETRATVVEPGEEMAMRCAVMDAFDWHDRARTMIKDQLGWKLVREVA